MTEEKTVPYMLTEKEIRVIETRRAAIAANRAAAAAIAAEKEARVDVERLAEAADIAASEAEAAAAAAAAEAAISDDNDP